MILVDSNVLIALVNEKDALFGRAQSDHDRFKNPAFVTIVPAFAEAIYLLPNFGFQRRLADAVDELPIAILPGTESISFLGQVIDWMGKYADHAPDFADACIAVLCGMDRRLAVWTYDSEFRTIWRRPDGSRIPLAVA